jgi:NAD(P)-dependent dehydrogenase (short-subunit alcohol dehydrogenase family)
MTISGRSALVIGGGSGVGRATVLALAREGAKVLAAGRTRDKLETVRKEAGPGVDIAVLDATDAEATKRLMSQADPDFVVVSAGVKPGSATIDGHTWESFSAPWNGDLKISFEVGQVALKRPLRPGSVVVIVSSGAGLGGSPISGGYAGAKRMQMFLASYLQGVSDARSLGLRFVALVPKQLIAGTEIAERAATAYGERAGISAEKYMERFGTPLTSDDVARVIVDVLRGELAAGVQVLGVTGKGVEPI